MSYEADTDYGDWSQDVDDMDESQEQFVLEYTVKWTSRVTVEINFLLLEQMVMLMIIVCLSSTERILKQHRIIDTIVDAMYTAFSFNNLWFSMEILLTMGILAFTVVMYNIGTAKLKELTPLAVITMTD